MGITGGIGAAVGVAGLGLQGAQHAQYTKQLEEQAEVTELQKKLAKYQLKQYEDQEREVAKEAAERQLYSKLLNTTNMRGVTPSASSSNMGMMTRSMTASANLQRNIKKANQMTNTGLGAIQRGAILEQEPLLLYHHKFLRIRHIVK